VRESSRGIATLAKNDEYPPPPEEAAGNGIRNLTPSIQSAILIFIREEHPLHAMTRKEKATFAAGCFWGVEAAFREVKGVISTQVGYTGGQTKNPTYEEVCSGKTGHAEAVEVIFDADTVSYQELLNLFWSIHDPTQLNRQGPDYGTNYRSAIFYHSEEQNALARESRKKLAESGRYGRRPIVTEIVPATPFYPAEEYHQQFYEKQGKKSCRIG
jgi:peptide-methionine (S)-S-oxide reductase